MLLALLGLAAADPWPVRHTLTNREGNQWLENKKAEADVITMPSGMAYKVLSASNDETAVFHPKADSACVVHFEAWLASNYPSGPMIDSSNEDGTALFTPSQMMTPVWEAMEMMVEGDYWEIYFDSPAQGEHSIWYSNDAFVFRIRIMQILGGKAAKFSPPSLPPAPPPSPPPPSPPPVPSAP